MKKGFTLAEILITLGIIGVVSALTIPTLVKRNTNETHVQQLKKAYATISEAFDGFMAENNAATLRDTYLLTGNIGRFLNENFKVSVDCGNTRGLPCFADTYKNLNGETVRIQNMTNTSSSSVMLSDGTAISMSDTFNPIFINIDVNGPKGPNIIGRDFFSLIYRPNEGMLKDYITDCQVDSTDRTNMLNNCSSTSNDYAIGCFRLIQLDGWKMDY